MATEVVNHWFKKKQVLNKHERLIYNTYLSNPKYTHILNGYSGNVKLAIRHITTHKSTVRWRVYFWCHRYFKDNVTTYGMANNALYDTTMLDTLPDTSMMKMTYGDPEISKPPKVSKKNRERSKCLHCRPKIYKTTLNEKEIVYAEQGC